MKAKIRVCKICNTEFEPKAHNQLCCSDKCKAINKKLCTKEYIKRRREEDKANGIKQPRRKKVKISMAKFPKYSLFYDKDIDKQREARINNDIKDTAQFNREARSLGLSYGQYEAKLNFERQQKQSIEYMLKNKRKEP